MAKKERKMSEHLSVFYFKDGKSRAELTRLILVYAQIPFNDHTL